MAKIGELFFNLRASTVAFSKDLARGKKQTKSAFGSMSKSVKVFGAALAAVGAARIIGAWSSAATEFEAKFANVATLLETRTPEGQAQLAKLRDQILDLNPALGGATELTEGLYQALSAGARPAAAVKLVAQAAKFAKAGLTDTLTAVDVFTTILNAYGLEAEEAGRVSAILFETIKQGKTTGEALAGSLGRAIPVAAALGVELTEVTAVIATLTKGGLATDEAVVALRASLNTILKPAAESEALARKMGISFAQMRAELKTKGLNAVLAEFAAKTKGNAAATAAFFGNVRALTGVLALTGKQAGEYADILGKLKKAADEGTATQEAFEKQIDTVQAKVDELGSAMEKGAIRTFEEAAPAIKEVIDRMVEFVSNSENVKTAAAGIAAAVRLIEIAASGAAVAMGLLTAAGEGLGGSSDPLVRLLDLQASKAKDLELAIQRLRNLSEGRIVRLDSPKMKAAIAKTVQLRQELAFLDTLVSASLNKIGPKLGDVADTGKDVVEVVTEAAAAVEKLGTPLVVATAGLNDFGQGLQDAVEGLGNVPDATGPAIAGLTEFEEAIQNLGEGIQFSVVDSLADWILGNQSLSESMKQLGRDVAQMITRMLLLKSIGSLFSAIPGFSAPEGRAHGGPVGAGQSFLVGERGPELFVPKSPGFVVPNNVLAGAGGPNITISIDATGADPLALARLENTIRDLARQLPNIIRGQVADDRMRRRF